MGKCLVLVGVTGSGKEEFVENFMKNYPTYEVVTLDQIKRRLYGTALKSDKKLEKTERNFLNDEVYRLLEQGRNVILQDGALRAQERKRFLTYIGKIEDAQISCVEFITPKETCKARSQTNKLTKEKYIKDISAYQPPTIEEGWHGIMKYEG